MSTEGKHALILAHGDRPTYEYLLHVRTNAGLFVATDGAANELAALGLPPDVVFGDFDSISTSLRSQLPNAEFVSAPDQEASDLDKAIEYVISRGYSRITVTGAIGGRLDHTLANASLLFKFLGQANIRFAEDRFEAWAANGGSIIKGERGDTLSLVAFASVESITLTGVNWPLNGERLMPGSRGVSNVMSDDEAHLNVKGGPIIVIHQKAYQ